MAEDLREKNWKAMEALTTVEKACEEKLLAATKAKEELAQQLDALQTRTKQTLLSALPGVTVSSQQDYDMWLQEFKEKTVGVLKQQIVTTEPPDSALKLKEAEEAQSTLQAECEQYRTILAETRLLRLPSLTLPSLLGLQELWAQLRLCPQEGMLRNLQKSVEEEEQVWKAKLTASEEELQKSHLQLKSLEGVVEKLKADLQSTDQVRVFGEGRSLHGLSQAPSPDLPLATACLGCVGPHRITPLLLSSLSMQLKEYTSLLETQLENHLETASSERQNYTKEVEAVIEAALVRVPGAAGGSKD
ncbi:hypothetical protein EK904_009004 [Melospiza melodia maxima]|nr:hypothetical protein EK904_009004 [Melospiza melodia maxima]